MSMRYRQVIEIEAGSHTRFPLDMLRYDGCYPERSEDCNLIEDRVGYDRLHEQDGQAKIRLVRFVEAQKCVPTVDRWRSFGWGCKVVETRKW